MAAASTKSFNAEKFRLIVALFDSPSEGERAAVLHHAFRFLQPFNMRLQEGLKETYGLASGPAPCGKCRTLEQQTADLMRRESTLRAQVKTLEQAATRHRQEIAALQSKLHNHGAGSTDTIADLLTRYQSEYGHLCERLAQSEAARAANNDHCRYKLGELTHVTASCRKACVRWQAGTALSLLLLLLCLYKPSLPAIAHQWTGRVLQAVRSPATPEPHHLETPPSPVSAQAVKPASKSVRRVRTAPLSHKPLFPLSQSPLNKGGK